MYECQRRTDIGSVGSLSMSTLADNYLVIHVPSEYDNLIENDKKTEIATVLSEYYQFNTGRELSVSFSDSVAFKMKTGSRQLSFQKVCSFASVWFFSFIRRVP